METWPHKTFSFWRKMGFNPVGKVSLLALSGGLDSTVLLHFWLKEVLPRYGGKVLSYHLDHALRPESRADSEWVEKSCQTMGVPLFLERLSPWPSNSSSFEAHARRERYDRLEKFRKLKKADLILTAHQQDDQLETFCLRILRSSGFRGLRGIHFQRDHVVRPFLNRTKRDLLEYAINQRLTWKEDTSNTDTRFARNRIRKFLASDTYWGNHSVRESVANICLTAQEIWPKIQVSMNTGSSPLEGAGFREPFCFSPPEKLENQFTSLSIYLEEQNIQLTPGIFRELLRQYERGLKAAVSMQGERTLMLSVRRIWIEKKMELKNRPRDSIQVVLKAGKRKWHWASSGKNYQFNIERFPRDNSFQIPKSKSDWAFFDADRLPNRAQWRFRQPGDRFSPLGTPSCTRRLKDYFSGIKLPWEKREEQLLLCDQRKIIWLPRLEISDDYKVTEETRDILKLEIRCLE